jgi:F-type H+-transporting ATPase subunit a
MTSEPLFSLFGIGITLPIVTTWAIMLFFLVFSMAATRRLTVVPGKLQNFLEVLVDFLNGQIKEIVRRDPWPFLPLIGALFCYVLVSNLSPLIPGLHPPTANFSTTTALAMVVFCSVPFYGVRYRGAKEYLKDYFRPVFIMLPFNIISELSRTISLTIRLFGNIMSGEIIVGVLLSLVPFFVPIVLSALGALTGLIQAYIFSILATVYIGAAVRATAIEHRSMKKRKRR